jgi:hypothetical protein
VNVTRVAAAFAMTLMACTAPPPQSAGLPIHHEGVAARMRLACGLGIATAPGATCANWDTPPTEMETADAADEAANESRDAATEADEHRDAVTHEPHD